MLRVDIADSGWAIATAIGTIVAALATTGAVLAALLWSLGTIAFKREATRVDAVWAVAILFLSGGVLLTVFGGVTEGLTIDWSPGFALALGYWASGRLAAGRATEPARHSRDPSTPTTCTETLR